MKHFFIALALIMLTKLDGSPLWVESTQVFVVQHSRDCAQQATTILIGGRPFCVKESINEVREKKEQGDKISPW